jgi:hypothetical protein
MNYTITTLAQSPHLQPQIDRLHDGAWSRFICEFMRIDATISQCWERLLTTFADYQILLHDAADQVVALGHTIPVAWDQTLEGLPLGWEDVLQRGANGCDGSNTLSALAIIVAPHCQGQGLSQQVLKTMKQIGLAQQFENLIAPVRPILKHQHPWISMEEYVTWQQAGQPFDPWIRAHTKVGGDFLCVAPASMVITAPVAQWEDWTEIEFPESGNYLVPGALHPIAVDREQNQGTYQEANVWMRHSTQPI